MDKYGVLKLYEKIAADVAEGQLANGFVPGIAPDYVAFVNAHDDSTDFRDSPEWGSASILSPWEAYQSYGDAEILNGRHRQHCGRGNEFTSSEKVCGRCQEES
jgi:alpha-L-rhamnosidase